MCFRQQEDANAESQAGLQTHHAEDAAAESHANVQPHRTDDAGAVEENSISCAASESRANLQPRCSEDAAAVEVNSISFAEMGCVPLQLPERQHKHQVHPTENATSVLRTALQQNSLVIPSQTVIESVSRDVCDHESTDVPSKNGTNAKEREPEKTSEPADDNERHCDVGGCDCSEFDHLATSLKEEGNAGFAKRGFFLFGSQCRKCKVNIVGEKNENGCKPTNSKPVHLCPKKCGHVMCTPCCNEEKVELLKEEAKEKEKTGGRPTRGGKQKREQFTFWEGKDKWDSCLQQRIDDSTCVQKCVKRESIWQWQSMESKRWTLVC